MTAATLAIIIQVIQAIIQETPAAISLFSTIKNIVSQNRDPTIDEWKTILQSMIDVHNQVQAANSSANAQINLPLTAH